MSIGIYKIENLINGNKYIGQSQNINQRWRSHRAYAETKDTPLYKAIRKYGIENFSFEILEECKIEELNDKEVYWINFYDSYRNGYNQTIGGDGNRHSVKLSEEQVFEIYKRLEGIETMEKIAKDYNVSHVTISNINTGMMNKKFNMENYGLILIGYLCKQMADLCILLLLANGLKNLQHKLDYL